MENIKKFENFSTNEGKKDKWIKDAIKKPGSLRKSLKKKEGEKITKGEIDSELQALKGKDKDPKKKGVQGLKGKDLSKFRKLNLARTLKSMKEHQETQNYMFFGNLQTMKRLIDKMLEMDESKIDEMLKEHNWALDHIATSKDDVEEVFNFLAGHESEEDHGYATHDGSFDGDDSEELLGGTKSSHTEHDNHMRNQVEENIKSFKNFK
jgi:hypothetical protein